MLAIDTNLVVRYLADDDPDQSSKAKADCKAFISFDRRLARTAARVGATEVRTP